MSENWTVISTPIKNNVTGKWEITINEPGKQPITLSFENEYAAQEKSKELIKNKLITKQEDFDKKIVLNDEQKLLILKFLENNKEIPAISDIVKKVFPNIPIKLQDGRSIYGKVIKEFIVEKGLEVEVKTEYIPKKLKELTDEQKEYIVNNIPTSKPLEIARELFNSHTLSPSSNEVKSVFAYVRTLDPKIIYGGEIPSADYTAPKSHARLVPRIQKYIKDTENWDIKKLTPLQKKNCDSLIGYLHSFRFKFQIDEYTEIQDKILFESTFIKYTYDKPDLSQEELDQYIMLSTEIVMATHIQKTIDMLQEEQNRTLEEDGKISMALVEAIKTARTEHDACVKRQNKLYDTLTETRKEKISKEFKDKESLLNVINAWKQYESRQNILKLAKDKKEKLKQAIHELESLDAIKASLMGLSVDEILNG